MLVQKIQVSISLIVLAAAMCISEASVQQLDSVGRMPEITVTAPRYEYQDEAWAGMVEGVVVEARRPPSKVPVMTTAERESGKYPVSMSLYSDGSSCAFLSLVLTLALVPISLISMSVGVYLGGKEVEQ